MGELIVTRHNHLVDPVLHVWAWQIPVYLFVGGLVAGMMIVWGWLVLRETNARPASRSGARVFIPLVGLVLLSVGMFALFLDLEHKWYVWRLYTAFRITSPMSWGAWILLLVYPALIAAALARPTRLLLEGPPGVRRSLAMFSPAAYARPIALTNIGLGIALGIYTGILLSSLGARPLWNSAMLGPLFLLSGLSSAAAFVHLVARGSEERVLLARADNVFLAIEFVALLLFIIGLVNASEAHRSAAGLLLGGSFSAVFWVGVVGVGILVPLVIQAAAVSHRVSHTPVGPILVLAGGLTLRFVIVLAGQQSQWATTAAAVFFSSAR